MVVKGSNLLGQSGPYVRQHSTRSINRIKRFLLARLVLVSCHGFQAEILGAVLLGG